jgi:hypothetical protein
VAILSLPSGERVLARLSFRGRRLSLIMIGCALTLVGIASTWLVDRWYTRYDRAYARLVPGTTKAEVLKEFGRPGYVTTSCSQFPSWDEKPLGRDSVKCVEEFEYFYRIRIGRWVVGFDADGRAVTKYYESSP